MQIFLQIVDNDVGFERARAGRTQPFSNGRVQVHEALGLGVHLIEAVRALVRCAVHKRHVGANEVGAGAPLPHVFRYVTQEDEHRKAVSELEFLEANAGHPVVDGGGLGPWPGCLSGEKPKKRPAIVFVDVSGEFILTGIGGELVLVPEFARLHDGGRGPES